MNITFADIIYIGVMAIFFGSIPLYYFFKTTIIDIDGILKDIEKHPIYSRLVDMSTIITISTLLFFILGMMLYTNPNVLTWGWADKYSGISIISFFWAGITICVCAIIWSEDKWEKKEKLIVRHIWKYKSNIIGVMVTFFGVYFILSTIAGWMYDDGDYIYRVSKTIRMGFILISGLLSLSYLLITSEINKLTKDMNAFKPKEKKKPKQILARDLDLNRNGKYNITNAIFNLPADVELMLLDAADKWLSDNYTEEYITLNDSRVSDIEKSNIIGTVCLYNQEYDIKKHVEVYNYGEDEESKTDIDIYSSNALLIKALCKLYLTNEIIIYNLFNHYKWGRSHGGY